MGEATPPTKVLPVDDAKLVERYQSQFDVVFPNVPTPKKSPSPGAQVVTRDAIRRIQAGARSTPGVQQRTDGPQKVPYGLPKRFDNPTVVGDTGRSTTTDRPLTTGGVSTPVSPPTSGATPTPPTRAKPQKAINRRYSPTDNPHEFLIDNGYAEQVDMLARFQHGWHSRSKVDFYLQSLARDVDRGISDSDHLLSLITIDSLATHYAIADTKLFHRVHTAEEFFAEHWGDITLILSAACLIGAGVSYLSIQSPLLWLLVAVAYATLGIGTYWMNHRQIDIRQPSSLAYSDDDLITILGKPIDDYGPIATLVRRRRRLPQGSHHPWIDLHLLAEELENGTMTPGSYTYKIREVLKSQRDILRPIYYWRVAPKWIASGAILSLICFWAVIQ